jgi:Na+-transporting methylmalonyl-CoA/oxaloacetate decarboxylase gamma subunit
MFIVLLLLIFLFHAIGFFCGSNLGCARQLPTTCVNYTPDITATKAVLELHL